MNEAFLQEILGKEGAAAVKNSLDKAPILKSVVFPRTIVAWLSVMNSLGFEGELPGCDDSYLSLVKSEDGHFNGAITIENSIYEFEQSDLLHVAATVGVALGVDGEEIDGSLKKKDLTQLGQSIDLLVKTQVLKKIRPQALDTSNEEPDSIPEASFVSSKPDKPKIKALKLTKNEAKSICEECGMPQFKDHKFIGCLCLRELAKSVKTKSAGNDYLLLFRASDLDFADISTIVAAFK